MAIQRFIAYVICEGISPQELAVRVQSMLSQGFMPTGGVHTAAGVGLTGPSGVIFYQALLLVQDKEIPDAQDPNLGPRALPKDDEDGPRIVGA